jgi:adenylate kinase family enzyme
MKIMVIGYSGAGKSTFSKRLASVYHLPVLHIDKIFFGPNWKERDKPLVEKEIRAFMNQESWLIDGHYRHLAKERFEQADTIYIFDFNRLICLYGAILRRIKYHNQSRDSIAEGCKERLNPSFIWWILFTGRKKDTKALLKSYETTYQQKVTVFHRRRQVNHYLRKVGYTGKLNYE